MLKLNTAAAEPFWLEILPAQTALPAKGKKAKILVPAQRTQFRPVTLAMILAAREEASRAVVDSIPSVKGKDDTSLPAPIEASRLAAVGQVSIVTAFAQLGIVAWEGVGDADGKPIEPTPAAILAYMSDWRVWDAVNRLYVQPALTGADEKNASAPSRNGTSGAGKNTAQAAKPPAQNAPSK